MKLTRTARLHLNRWRGEAKVDGIRLPLSAKVISPNMEWTLAKGRYEWGEARMGARAVAPGDTVLELGSGIGFVSSYLRRNTAAGKIVCVEANPDLVPYIENVHRLNGIADTVVLNGVAQVPPFPASMPFYCRRDFWASSLEPTSAAYERAVEVPSLDLAQLLDKHKPGVLIMDIEGGELALMQIAALPHVRAIVMEVHRDTYGDAGLQQLFDLAARLGFARDPAGTAREVHTLARAA
ncbi:FkbM family methyltransferase [Hyphomicrobium sp. xq]|uniref:FkbM family methyltransferase n=1 Tax=Hyphomicrobium album TaxID=2665159 RepID=A0A6I3KP55_9HYPH|nr:FkbM family methyltransferase [Hyphomicrobium album]MTD96309.1 FkbM family methyltransferase [Hyphomicrobium album]